MYQALTGAWQDYCEISTGIINSAVAEISGFIDNIPINNVLFNPFKFNLYSQVVIRIVLGSSFLEYRQKRKKNGFDRIFFYPQA
jgi:hypothetical protein